MTPSRLPTEVKAAILAFADQATLASCCSVSLELLELAGPLLYRSVRIDGIDRLEKLFCSTVSLSLFVTHEEQR